MTTPQDYRTLVNRLESIQESPVVTPRMVQSATNAVTSPDTSGSVLRALLTNGMSVVPEIVAFLMKNKSQLSPKCQGILQQFDPKAQATAPSFDPSTVTPQPSPQPQATAPSGANPSVLIPGKSV
jgi:hypothetical protein